jgi:hypothetical protein
MANTGQIALLSAGLPAAPRDQEQHPERCNEDLRERDKRTARTGGPIRDDHRADHQELDANDRCHRSTAVARLRRRPGGVRVDGALDATKAIVDGTPVVVNGSTGIVEL